MFIEQWSVIIVNTISLIIWIIDIISFCSFSRKNNLILGCVDDLLRIMMYGCDGLWFPCITSATMIVISLYNAFFKSFNVIFSFIFLAIAITFNVIKIGSISSANMGDTLPIISLSVVVIGTVFCKSIHSLRILKGINAMIWLFYNSMYSIIFSAAQNLFFIFLMLTDILLNALDKRARMVKILAKK